MTDIALEQVKQAPMQAMEMIQVAFQKALDAGGPEALAVADRIIEQMAKQRDYEARDHFNNSLLRIQQALKPIAKRGHGEKPGQKYALIEDIDSALNPLLAREGMTLSFEPSISDKPNMITVAAVLAQGAYERRYPIEMPADGAGPKGGSVMTRTHATGSAMTYGKRYLKNFIFDLQFKQADDDGRAAGGGELDPRARADLFDAIEAAQTVGEVTANYIKALQTLTEIGAKDPGFKAAANKRKTELQRGN
jgi:hypothetical protein